MSETETTTDGLREYAVTDPLGGPPRNETNKPGRVTEPDKSHGKELEEYHWGFWRVVE